MIRTAHKLGENLVICDIGGEPVYGSETITSWDGLVTCKRHYNPKHSQLEIRPIKEGQVPTMVSPHPADVFSLTTDPYPLEQ